MERTRTTKFCDHEFERPTVASATQHMREIFEDAANGRLSDPAGVSRFAAERLAESLAVGPIPDHVVNIARCPEHGLHGQRTECFICGGPVEQVAMVPAPPAPSPEAGE